jgi:hypothetical protein
MNYSLLSTANTKLKKAAAKHGSAVIASFTLPAIISCPMRGKCAAGCYATAGAFCWPVPKKKHQFNMETSRLPEFTRLMNAEVMALLLKAEKQGKRLFVRVHDSGDYYSEEYLNKWLTIARLNPNVTFYSYTKSVSFVRHAQHLLGDAFPSNFVFTFSEGGREDALVQPEYDKHTKMFNSEEELFAAGYSNASANDLIAAAPGPNWLKVGLVFHGSARARKAWGLA